MKKVFLKSFLTILFLVLMAIPLYAYAQSAGWGGANFWKQVGTKLQLWNSSLEVELVDLTISGTCTGCGGTPNFIGLTDTPGSYSGDGGKVVKVNIAENALEFVAQAGGGDVTGPSIATNNAIARFDSTTGKLIQNSSSTVSDTGVINIPSGATYQINSTNLAYTDITNAIALVSLSATAPLTYNNGTGAFGINQSGVGTDGYLSSVDWNTFNNKWDALSDMALADGDIYIGNVSNNPAGVTMVGDGTIDSSGDLSLYIREYFNGTFREYFDFRVVSDGSVATGTLRNACGTSTLDMTMMFSDGDTVLETSDGSAQIVLTAGTDSGPVKNYVYIPKSTKILTKSTTDWPDTEHIRVAFIYAGSASYMQNDGPYINQNWNDDLNDCNNQGHTSHIGNKIREGLKGYFSGLAGDGDASTYIIRTDATPDTVYVAMATGTLFQFHKQIFTAKDTSAGDDFHVVNQNGDAFADGTDLYNFLTDADGDSMAGKYYNIVLWVTANKTGEYSPLMINLPTCSYTSLANAEQDVSNCDVFDIPREFILDSSTGYLVARLTMKHGIGSQDLELESTVDLRGINPTSVSGGANTTHDPVTLAGAYDYLVISGQEITLDQINLATDVTGILPTANVQNLSGTNTGDETSSTFKTLIDTTVASTAPTDTDKFSFSGLSLFRHITWANIKASLKTYFDTLYALLSGFTMAGDITMGSNDIRGVGDLVTASSSHTTAYIGNLTLGNAIANTYGGTGQNSSGWSGFVYTDSGTWSASSSIASSKIQDAYLFNTGDVGTGAYDFGGATSFEIPNGTNLTLDATGEIGMDTHQLLAYDGSNVRVHSATGSACYNLASSTMAGKEDVDWILTPGNITIYRQSCKVNNGTSIATNITDGTNDMDPITCGTTWTHDFSLTNNQFLGVEYESIKREFGTNTGASDYLTYCIYWWEDRL